MIVQVLCRKDTDGKGGTGGGGSLRMKSSELMVNGVREAVQLTMIVIATCSLMSTEMVSEAFNECYIGHMLTKGSRIYEPSYRIMSDMRLQSKVYL